MKENKKLESAVVPDPRVSMEPVAVRVSVAAKLLGVSIPKVYELIGREDFRGVVRLGRCTLVSVAALREWVEAHREGGD